MPIILATYSTNKIIVLKRKHERSIRNSVIWFRVYGYSTYLAVAMIIASKPTYCDYRRRDGQAELAWVAGKISGHTSACNRAITQERNAITL